MKKHEIKLQKDKDIALNLAIQRLQRIKYHIDNQILFLKRHIGNKKHYIGTYEGSDKIWITQEPTY
jgi:hypothetical protein